MATQRVSCIHCDEWYDAPKHDCGKHLMLCENMDCDLAAVKDFRYCADHLEVRYEPIKGEHYWGRLDVLEAEKARLKSRMGAMEAKQMQQDGKVGDLDTRLDALESRPRPGHGWRRT